MATKDRTSLKNDFANGKYATGEKFADLIDSMKVVQEPVADPAASGTSISFIDSIEQDKDGKITATKKTLDLANAHELNPFKGWYKTGDTLPTDGFDGAYLYFKDTSEQTGLTTIYRWNGTTYVDTGTVVDTSNVQTFGSGQQVNTVKIKDENGEEVTGPAGVLSAAAGQILSEEINGDPIPAYANQTVDDVYRKKQELDYTIPSGTKILSVKYNGTETEINGRTESTDATVQILYEGVTTDRDINWVASNFHSGPIVILSEYTLENEGLLKRVDDVVESVDTLEGTVNTLTENANTLTSNVSSLSEEINGDSAPDYANQTIDIVVQTKKELDYTIPNGTKILSITHDSEEISLNGRTTAGGTIQVLSKGVTTNQDIKWVASNFVTGTVVISTDYPIVNEGISKRVSNIEESMDMVNASYAKIVVPSDIYALRSASDNLQIFFRSIIQGVDPYANDIEIRCAKGETYRRYYEFKVNDNNDASGDYPMKFVVKNNNYDTIDSVDATLHLISPSEPSSTKNILVVGASTYSDGLITAELYRRICTNTGTLNDYSNPLGLNWSNVAFVGRNTVASGGYTIKQEATGGYGWKTFATNAFKLVRLYFSVSSYETGIQPGDKYRIDGVATTSDYQLIAISQDDDNDVLFEPYGGYVYTENIIPSSGTLRKVSGNGPDSISYTNRAFEDGNPFWDSTMNEGAGGISFAKYSTDYLDGAPIDIVVAQFGSNDFRSITELNQRFEYVIAFIEAYETYISANNINGKFLIGGIQLPNYIFPKKMTSNDLTIESGIYGKKIIYFEYIRKLKEAIENYDFVQLMDTTGEFDSEYGYYTDKVIDKNVNNRTALNEKVGNNEMHPTSTGKKMIADSIFRNIIKALNDLDNE